MKPMRAGGNLAIIALLVSFSKAGITERRHSTYSRSV